MLFLFLYLVLFAKSKDNKPIHIKQLGDKTVTKIYICTKKVLD